MVEPPSKNLAISRVRVAGPQKGRRGQVRSEEAELAITTSFLRRTLSVVGVRAQAKLLLGRLEVIGPFLNTELFSPGHQRCGA